jgi:HSP20 family protein
MVIRYSIPQPHFPFPGVFHPVEFEAPRDGFTPQTDILESPEGYRIQMELPGVQKEDVKIAYKNQLLTIQGVKKLPEKSDGDSYYCQERVGGSFRRSFRIGEEIDAAEIRAEYSRGVLEIFLPKPVKTAPRTAEIKIQ